MRAGPLSNPQVIDLLNKYFVPVTSANELRDDDRVRIYHEFHAKGLGIGDVHVYVVGPDGAAFAGLDIGRAMDAGKEIEFLTKVANDLHTQPGPPVFAPHPQSAAPNVPTDAPAIHLVSRKLIGKTSWNEFPSENWIVLSKQEWDQVLPSADAKLQATWQLPPAASTKLAEWIYPQTEETRRTNRNRVDEANFRLTLATLKGTMGRAKIEGHVRLRHSFYPGKPSEDFATSDLVGYVDFDLTERLVKRFRLVTKKADYNGTAFACSLVSVSRETIEGQR
jgi:hypothetical protein